MFINAAWPKTFRVISVLYDRSRLEFPGRERRLMLLQATIAICSGSCGAFVMWILNPENTAMIRFVEGYAIPHDPTSDGSRLLPEEQQLLYDFFSISKALLAWVLVSQVYGFSYTFPSFFDFSLGYPLLCYCRH